MKQKYKSGDLLVDFHGNIIEVLAHSTAMHHYLCHQHGGIVWVYGKYLDTFKKIGTL